MISQTVHIDSDFDRITQFILEPHYRQRWWPELLFESYPEAPGLAFNISVDDIEVEYASLKDRVQLLTKGIEQSPGGPYFAIADPSGNVIEIIQFD